MKKTKKKKLEDFIPDKAYREEVLNRLERGDDLIGKEGIFTDLLQALINASLEGELDHHLRQEKQKGEVNRRNGKIDKRIRSNAGKLKIQTPRDRKGSFEPKLIPKRQRSLGKGLDEAIQHLYAKGNSVDDISVLLKDLYGVKFSEGLISSVTDRVWPEIVSWQQRPLSACYAIVYLDAIHYRVRVDGSYKSHAVYSVYGVDAEGKRDVLGLYQAETEGASTWAMIVQDIKHRGVDEVLFFCIDGLKGFKQAIEASFPQALVQRCIVHKIRNTVRFVSDKDKKKVCADLRKVYTAANQQAAQNALDAFNVKWGNKYKTIVPSWQQDWHELMVFMDFTEHIRRMIYTTNPVEALHRIMRKVTKSKGAWVSQKALLKQLYLALTFNEKSWKRKAFHWSAIQRELIEKFGDRYLKYLTA